VATDAASTNAQASAVRRRNKEAVRRAFEGMVTTPLRRVTRR
jgi:hypothetical protein